MSREANTSPDVVPAACRFFLEVIADPAMTDHDENLVAAHTKDCDSCEAVIGQAIHEKIESNRRAEASGT